MSKTTVEPSAPFVGRETELHQLHQALKSVVVTKQPKFTLIQGDFGVGKTALVARFLADVSAEDPSILIGQGRCAMETGLTGLIPFSQLLVSLTEKGIQGGAVLGNLWKFTKEVAPAWLDIFTAGAASAVVKTAEEGSKLLGRSKLSQENVFVQFSNALAKLAEKQPVVAFIDDLQWADASSLKLLFHLARHLHNRAVLFVCTYRPVEAMETGPNATLFRDIRANLIRYGAIELDLRQGIDVAEYITRRYPLNAFSRDFIGRVQELTGGHALFVSQLFSLWEETEVVTLTLASYGRSVWVVAPDAEEQSIIPQTLGGVLEERIRLMEDDLRDLMTLASVEGEDFTAQVIARLQQLDELKLYDSLETLEHRYRLVQEQGTKEVDSTVLDFYRFVHRFFRDYIYNQLSGGKRRALHRRVGECLEALHSDRHEIAGQLTLHFHEAREPMKSARYALMAAQFEQSRYTWSEGERWCEFGLALVDKLTPDVEVTQLRLDLLEQSGQGYYYAGDYDRTDKRYRDAIELAQRLNATPEHMANLYARMADICDELDQYEEGMRFVEQGKDILSEHAIPIGEAHLKLSVMEGLLHSRLGRNEMAIQLERQMLADAEKLPQTSSLESIQVEAYNSLAIALGYLNYYTESIPAYQKAIGIADRIGDKYMAAVCLSNLADDYALVGKLDEAEASVSRALGIARQIGDQAYEAFALAIKGSLLLQRGKPHEAVRDLQQAIALSERAGLMWEMTYGHADLALAYLSLHDLETAYQHARQSLTIADDIGRWKAYALDVLGQVEAARQKWEQAIEHFEQSIALRREAGERHFAAQTQRHYAEALLKKGEYEKAVELLQSALATFQELKLLHEINETQRLLDTSKTYQR